MLKGHLQGNTGLTTPENAPLRLRLGTRWRVVADCKSEIAGGLAEYIVTLSTTQRSGARPDRAETARLRLAARGLVVTQTRPDSPMVAHRPLAGAEPGLGAVRSGALAEAAGLAAFGRRHWVSDLVYLLLASALVALGWAVVKTVWTYAALRGEVHAR